MLPWIFLLLSAGAWWIVFTTRSMVELALALIAALAFLLLGFYGLLAARVGHVTRTQSAREKALLLTTRPKPQAGPTAATGPDGGGFSVGVDHGGSPSGGRSGAARTRAADDRSDTREGAGDATDGGGDGGGGGD
jgi:hypothetical protein